MIEPPPARWSAGMPNLARRNGPPRFTSIASRQSSSEVSGAVPVIITPALAYSTCTAPQVRSAVAISASTSSGLVTSQKTKTAVPPCSSISRTTRLPSSSRLEETTTLAPSAANRIAPARPMPELAPVMTATLPARRPAPTPPAMARSRTLHPPVGDVQGAVDDLEPIGELLLADAQGRVGHHVPPSDESVEAVLQQVALDRLHLVAGAVERRHGLERGAVADELQHPEQPDVPRGADAGAPLGQPGVVGPHHLAQLASVLDQAVLLVDADRRQRRRQRERVGAVGEPSEVHVLLEVLRDGRAHRDRPERDVARGEPLGDRHDVRHDAPVVHREPFAGAAEPRHDLVGDQQDAVAVAEGAHPLEVAVRRDQDAVGPADRLEDERRDRARSLELDRLLQVGQGRLGVVDRTERPVVGVQHVDHTDQARLVRPAARVARQADGPAGGAVIRAVPRQDLLAPGDRPGDPDGVVVGLGATEREEDLGDVTGEDLRQLLPEAGAGLGGHEGADVGEPLRLALDRLHDAPVAVARRPPTDPSSPLLSPNSRSPGSAPVAVQLLTVNRKLTWRHGGVNLRRAPVRAAVSGDRQAVAGPVGDQPLVQQGRGDGTVGADVLGACHRKPHARQHLLLVWEHRDLLSAHLPIPSATSPTTVDRTPVHWRMEGRSWNRANPPAISTSGKVAETAAATETSPCSLARANSETASASAKPERTGMAAEVPRGAASFAPRSRRTRIAAAIRVNSTTRDPKTGRYQPVSWAYRPITKVATPQPTMATSARGMPPHDPAARCLASPRVDASTTPRTVRTTPAEAMAEGRSPWSSTDRITATAAYDANTGLTTAIGPSWRARYRATYDTVPSRPLPTIANRATPLASSAPWPGSGVSSRAAIASTSTTWITSSVAATPIRRVLMAPRRSAKPNPIADPRPKNMPRIMPQARADCRQLTNTSRRVHTSLEEAPVDLSLYTDMRPAPGADLRRHYQEVLEEARLAERLGFHGVWTTEQHGVDDGYLPAQLPALAAFAMRTSRLRLGTGVILLPLAQPRRVVEEACVVDVLSGGRLTLGVGAGNYAHEFRAFGVPRERRGRILEESIRFVRPGLGGQPLPDGLPVNVQPVQRPIPLVVGGLAEPAVDRAARLAEGHFAYAFMDPAEELTRLWSQRLGPALERHGRAPSVYRVVAAVVLWVSDDPARGSSHPGVLRCHHDQ